jgi:hypothetical protein
MKFSKGQKVEVRIPAGWAAGEISFIWRAVDLETNRRVFLYNVRGVADAGAWELRRVAENSLRRPNRARGRRRVLRAHSVNRQKWT